MARSRIPNLRTAPIRWRRGTKSSGTQTRPAITVAAKDSKDDANFSSKGPQGAN